MRSTQINLSSVDSSLSSVARFLLHTLAITSSREAPRFFNVSSVEGILEFLQHLLDHESGLAASTKVYAAAIFACHEGFARTTVFAHPLVRSFLAGVRRLRPVARATAPQWVLPLVLNTLYGAPFEPLGGASLKWLSVKTALLLALATGKRVSDLQALSIQAGCLVISGDASKAVLRPNPSFVPKVVQSPFAARPVELAAFFPPPHASGEEERLPALCPVCALAEYIRRTAGVRSTSQFLVCYGPGKVGSPLSKQRLSHWLCEGIVHAYEAAGRPTPGSVRAHSTRGMAASAALFGGVPVADICAATPWATPSPFIHYFLLDMAPVSSASSVLGSASANVQ